MTENKKFIVWSGIKTSRGTEWFYNEDHITLMTEDFCEATIFDDLDEWKLAHNPKIGRFQIHQASAANILKWKLQNKVPSDRL